MSQEGPIDVLGTFPQIPTEFVADIGSAIPILNILNVLGTTQAAGTSPLHTTGSGNTLTIINQLTQAAALSASNIAGLASFNSADFSVDANGFVSSSGANITLTGDTGGALSPTAGNFNIVTNSESGSSIKFDGTVSTLKLHVTDAGNNTIIGNLAGNGTLTGTASTALGFSALNALTSGVNNVAMGANALILATSSQNNVAIGTHALASIVTGGFSTAVGSLALTNATNGGTAVGYGALGALTTGQNNCCVGFSSGGSLIGGNNNTAIGQNSGATWSSSSDCTALGDAALFASTGDRNTAVGSQAIFGAGASANNTAVGYQSALNLTSGSQNSLLGYHSLVNGTTASYNICIGYTSGNAYTTSESSNLIIGNTGTLAESNTTRIGTQGSGSGQQNRCFIAGIVGVTPSNQQLVAIDSATGQLGVATNQTAFWNVASSNQTGATDNGYIFVSPGGALTVSLPTTSAAGDEFIVALDGATSWQITQAASQQIRVGANTTTLGATGTLTSTAQGDSVTLVCRVANTLWTAISVIGVLVPA